MSVFKNLFSDNKVFLKNSYFLYLSHFADYFLLLFFLPFIAKNIGAEEFGKISLSQTFGVFIVLIFEFGSPLFLTREVAVSRKSRLKLDLLLIKSLVMKFYILPICIILTMISVHYVPIFKENPFFIYLVFLGSFAQGITPAWYFAGQEKMKIIGLSKIICRVIGFIFIITFVRDPNDGWIVLAGYTLTSCLICAYLFYESLKDIKTLKLPSFQEIKVLLSESSNSFLITFFPVIYQTLSMILLSIFVNPIQLGLFYGANRIYRALNSLYSPIGQAFFPKIAFNNLVDSTLAKGLIKNFTAFFLVFGTLMFTSLFLFSKQIISILLGVQFHDASIVLILFGSVLPLTALSHVLGRQWMMATNQDSIFMKIQFLSSSFSFIVFILMINKYGIISIPISLISYELSSIFLIIIYLFNKNTHE